MEGSKFANDLNGAQHFLLSNHFRMSQANKATTPARTIKALGGGGGRGGGGSRGRQRGNGNKGKGDRSGNTGYKGTILKSYINLDNNTWYNLMAQKQADSVNKLCAEKARSAAALGQKQDASDDDASVASTAKNDGAQFGREGKKGKRKRG